MGAAPVRVPRQSRGRRTRRRLVEAAQAEFSERGYAHATASSIARRAGVATGTFYQYFQDKDAVLHELAADRMEGIRDRVMAIMQEAAPAEAPVLPVARARMRAVVEAVVDYHREDPGLHAVLTERRHADPSLDALTGHAEHTLVAQIAELLRGFGRREDAEATAFVLFGMVEGAVHAHVLGRPVVSDERFNRALVDAMVRIALPTSEEEEP
ncbi:MAG: TetR/AcrR family transcriptional regulator [Myxococcota bacterium]